MSEFYKIRVIAVVTKAHNSAWAGIGLLTSTSFTPEDGVVLIKMLTGPKAGEIGGFDIDKLKFRVERLTVGENYYVKGLDIGLCTLREIKGAAAVVEAIERPDKPLYTIPLSALW